MNNEFYAKGIGTVDTKSGLIFLDATSDGRFLSGKDGVKFIFTAKDRKVEYIAFENHTLAFVPSVMGYNAYYPIEEVSVKKPVKAVLMDLDGTSVKSETFWMLIIQKTVSEFISNKNFEFEECDKAHIAGHSVSEHLTYCINKYCPGTELTSMRKRYNEIVAYEMSEIIQGRGNISAFKPTDGLKDFLLELKSKNVKIGLVTSGLYEKAMPEIISAFKTLNMGDPLEFYDAIITAGTPFKKGQTGCMCELPIKPHPWVYSETGCFGLNIKFEERNQVVAIEDSGAGVSAARLAGYYTIGLAGGNIVDSGNKFICNDYVDTLEQIIKNNYF